MKVRIRKEHKVDIFYIYALHMPDDRAVGKIKRDDDRLYMIMTFTDQGFILIDKNIEAGLLKTSRHARVIAKLTFATHIK